MTFLEKCLLRQYQRKHGNELGLTYFKIIQKADVNKSALDIVKEKSHTNYLEGVKSLNRK